MGRIHLGLGSNLGDRLAHLRAGLAALGDFARLLDRSPVYETAPLYRSDQPSFLNMVAAAETDLAPRLLLARLKEAERRLGRMPGPRNGPRVIDLDILFYDDQVVAEDDLILPHPGLAERHFVLMPLADIAAGLIHPVSRLSVAEMLARLPAASGIRRWGEAP